MSPRRARTISTFAASAVVSLAALAEPVHALAPLRLLSHRVIPAENPATNDSLNWSGYVKRGRDLRSSAASWHVPSLRGPTGGYSSTWVGIDGASPGDQYLIQTGVECDLIHGKALYEAWWEVITPSQETPAVTFRGLTIHAGDSVRASIARRTDGAWSLQLRDDTTEKSATHIAAFDGAGASVEWIQEDTQVGGYISPAPNWRSVTFADITVNGDRPALVSSQGQQIVDNDGTQEDSVSSPNAARDGFTLTWLAAGTHTYVG